MFMLLLVQKLLAKIMLWGCEMEMGRINTQK